jgi:uncharacterized membrane protein
MAEHNHNARLEAFSDGVFAIALTLLVLDIKLPNSETIHTSGDLWLALFHIVPSIVAFLLSFTIVLIAWVNHHAAFQLVDGSSVSGTYANGFLLLTIVILPFPTSLVGEYVLTDHAAPAVILYVGVQALQAVGWIWLAHSALRNNLAKNERAKQHILKNLNYGYYALGIYSLCAVLAFWFPLAIAIVTIAIWAGWLAVGMNMKRI